MHKLKSATSSAMSASASAKRGLSKSKFRDSRESNISCDQEVTTNHRLFDNLDEWLTHTEACDYLRISSGALRNMVWRGAVSAYKLGRRVRYYKIDLRNLLLQGKKGGFQ